MAKKQSATEPQATTDLPDARSHLPRPVERRLLKPYAGSALGRVTSGSALRALSVLVRKHPKAALHVFASGTATAGRIGWSEVRHKLASLTARILPSANAKTAENIGGEPPEAAPARDELDFPSEEETEAVDFPPELLEAARNEIVAELGEAELEEMRKLLHEAERRRCASEKSTL